MSDEPTTETETTSGEDATPETNNAPVIAPDASTTPVTKGRRSHRPDGQDPFHAGR